MHSRKCLGFNVTKKIKAVFQMFYCWRDNRLVRIELFDSYWFRDLFLYTPSFVPSFLSRIHAYCSITSDSWSLVLKVNLSNSPDQMENLNVISNRGHHSPDPQEVTHRDTIWSVRSASSVKELIHGWRSRASIRASRLRISKSTCEEKERRCLLLWRPENAKKSEFMSCLTLWVHRTCSLYRQRSLQLIKEWGNRETLGGIHVILTRQTVMDT